jgi:hypothetical protein
MMANIMPVDGGSPKDGTDSPRGSMDPPQDNNANPSLQPDDSISKEDIPHFDEATELIQ